jgi:hypothetical protein
MLPFSDDNYIPKIDCVFPELISDMEKHRKQSPNGLETLA